MRGKLLSRRQLLKGAGVSVGALALAACQPMVVEKVVKETVEVPVTVTPATQAAAAVVAKTVSEEVVTMDRASIYAEIEEILGQVPTFLQAVPDSTLEQEWSVMKTLQIGEGAISGKNAQLIQVALSAATRCQYCIYFHTEVAKLKGATDEEINLAVHLAANSSHWSAWLNGLQIDLPEFRQQIDEIVAYKKAKAAAAKK